MANRTLSRLGTTLGRYVVLEELGRGSMGVVLRAYDPKLEREVALKVLKAKRLPATAHERMIREARAMAQLSHPNVVAVYDVENDLAGRVVLAMELVRGVPLDRWLKDDHSWREIVERFVEAGQGLAAAHAVGLLHRDFKPPNVLVGERAMVTDFGLARAQGSWSRSTSEDDDSAIPEEIGSLSLDLTADGTVLGTPAYMAPEQHMGEELTPAADQFALCVSLWYALTGQRPYPVEGSSLVELVEAKLGGPPPWPRGSEVPRAVVAAIRRGLCPEPGGRWPSVSGLLDELTRVSKPRGRRVVVVGVAVIALGGAWALSRDQPRPCSGAEAMIAEAWGPERRAQVEASVRATELPFAGSAWDRLASRLDGYSERWRGMHTEACEATMVRREQSTTVMDARMACLHRARTALAAASELLTDADAQILERADRLVDGLPPLDHCEDIDALLASVTPPKPDAVEAVEAARVRLARATALLDTAKLEEASAVVAELVTTAESLAYEPLLTEVALARSRVLEGEGRYEEASESTKQALRRALRQGQWPEAFTAARSLVFVVGFRLGRGDEALAYAELAWGMVERAGLSPGEAELALRNNIANTLSVQGQLLEAEQELRACLELHATQGDSSWRGPQNVQLNLARVLQQQGKARESEAVARAAVAGLEETLGPDHPATAVARTNVANALYYQERFVEAEAELRKVIDVSRAIYGDDHPDVAKVRLNLSLQLEGQGRIEEAMAENTAALAILERTMPPDHPDLAMIRHNRSTLLSRLGRHEEADAGYVAAIEHMVQSKGPDYHAVAMLRSNRGRNLIQGLGRREEGLAELREAIRIYGVAFEPDNPTLAWSRVQLGEELVEGGDHAEALVLLEAAWTVLDQGAETPQKRGHCGRLLAEVLWSSGEDRARARRLAEQALASLQEAGAEHAEEAEEVEAWLQSHPLP